MRAVHLATMDRGGAGIAAARLHIGLRLLGVNSTMMVARKHSDTPHLDVLGPGDRSLSSRLRRRIAASVIARERLAYARTAPAQASYLTDDRVPAPCALDGGLPQADIFHLHWITGLIDPRRFFVQLPDGKPLVWTLHDMNPFTGGCHYALNCCRYVAACGSCPQLGSHAARDLSARIHARKAAAYSQLRPETTRLVTPSGWLAHEASRSSLLRRFQVDVIPNGVDVEVFSPRERRSARERFSVPKDNLVLAFSADQIGLRLKGFDLLQEALSGLNVARPVTVAVIGKKIQGVDTSRQIVWLGEINNERMMSFALSTADVFVLPTRADNFPNVILEAMACGVPVVAFGVGGVPEMVRPGQTGLLAPAEDACSLRTAIEILLGDDGLRENMSAACRRTAVEEYAIVRQAERYRAIYEELMEASTRLLAV